MGKILQSSLFEQKCSKVFVFGEKTKRHPHGINDFFVNDRDVGIWFVKCFQEYSKKFSDYFEKFLTEFENNIEIVFRIFL